MGATKDTKKTVAALRQAADAIDKGTVVYEWSELSTCPVGVFACALFGVSQWWLRDRVKHYQPGDDWATYIKRHRTADGDLYSKETALAELLKAMPADELEKLEYLSDEDVAWRAAAHYLNWPLWRQSLMGCLSLNTLNCERADHAVAYMKALADKLEAEACKEV